MHLSRTPGSLAVAAVLFLAVTHLCAQTQEGAKEPLPNAPSATRDEEIQDSVTVNTTAAKDPEARMQRLKLKLKPCRPSDPDCAPTNKQIIVNGPSPNPVLSPLEKLELAGRGFIDPFNLTVIGMSSAASVAIDPHGSYGPGIKGFSKSAGVGLTGSLTGEFFGTFAVPALMHQDPRYHRMPDGTFKRRLWHAFSRSFVSQADDGHAIPNYSALLTYPIANELANAYVPGIQRDAKSTGTRIAIGYATDPIGNLIAEFLPDVASHIHVRGVFFQQIINKIATDPTLTQ